MFWWAMGSTILISLISLVGAITLFLNEKILNKIVLLLVGFSAGALLGGAFFHLLPEATEQVDAKIVYLWVIFGILAFFALEKLLYWRHCHKDKCEIHAFTYLNLVGDGFHNLIDGMVIAASYLVNFQTGIVTTIAIISHEIPQELGDFGILVYGGFSKGKALFWNFMSALTAVVGTFIGFYLYKHFQGSIPLMLGFTAGGFIYIAGTDLIPELHKKKINDFANFGSLFFILGLVFMYITALLGH